jgi:hypothetical protein
MIVNPARLLTLEDLKNVLIAVRKDSGPERIKATRGFLRSHEVIPKSEGKEADTLKPMASDER